MNKKIIGKLIAERIDLITRKYTKNLLKDEELRFTNLTSRLHKLRPSEKKL